MATIQPILTDKLVNYLDQLIYYGKVKLNGEYVDYSIHKTVVDGNILRKYIYLQSEEGNVAEAQLLSSANEVLAIKPMSIEKQEDGLVLAFEFAINIQEVN